MEILDIKKDPSGNGKWLLRFSDGAALSFNSQAKAVEFMSKLKTAKAIVECVQTLTAVMDSGPDLWQEYWDVVAADGAFTDNDVDKLGITAAQLTACVTLLENMKKFFGNEAVQTNSYRVTVNNVRRV